MNELLELAPEEDVNELRPPDRPDRDPCDSKPPPAPARAKELSSRAAEE